MADDLNKEPLDNIPTDQRDPPIEIIPAEETKSITPIQQTENMEVHHPHHVTHKKKWTEYLLEFFMLFLAVFLGFLAENQREHYVEHQREKQYITSMIEDIRSDTALLVHGIFWTNKILQRNDSLLTELQNPGILTNSKRAYYLWSESDYYLPFVNNDRTIQQLKNSGGLRLIRNKNVSDSIMEYDREFRWLFGSQDRLDRMLINNVNYTYRLFSTMSLSMHNDSPVPLLNSDKKFIEEVYGYRVELKDKIRDYIFNQQNVFNRGRRLIAYIKKEYHLE